MKTNGIQWGLYPFRFDNRWLKVSNFDDKSRSWWEAFETEDNASYRMGKIISMVTDGSKEQGQGILYLGHRERKQGKLFPELKKLGGLEGKRGFEDGGDGKKGKASGWNQSYRIQKN